MKTILAFLLPFLICFAAKSQYLNVKTGFSISTWALYGPHCPYLDFDNITGLSTGANFEYMLSKEVSLTLGLEYSGRGYTDVAHRTLINGFKTPADTLVVEWNVRERLNYLDVPMAIRVLYKIDRRAFFYGFAGPYVARFVGGDHTQSTISMDSRGEYVETSQEKYTSWNKPHRMWDFGFNAGGGVCIHGFFLEAHFSHGLRNLYPVGKGETIYRLMNKAGVISLGYSVNLRKKKKYRR